MAQCTDLIPNIIRCIDDINYQLADTITNENFQFNMSCVRTDVSNETYYEKLAESFEKVINARDGTQCLSVKLLDLGIKLADINLDSQEVVLETILKSGLASDSDSFKMSPNLFVFLQRFAKTMYTNCDCELVPIFKIIFGKYSKKFFKNLETDPDAVDKLKTKVMDSYETFKSAIKEFSEMDSELHLQSVVKAGSSIDNRIRSELDNLIPPSMGSMKDYFIEIITAYFTQMHPVIWAPMLKSVVSDVFVALPFSKSEWFSFLSKHLLINSGPFILKVLQTIRPVLTESIALKYGIKKLKTPMLSKLELELILPKVCDHRENYKIIANKSASVGHVCIMHPVTDPTDIFVVKIIKPLSIAQSCSEFKVLSKVYPPNTCEHKFIINTLESNGSELNVFNEKDNVTKGSQYYNCDYKDVFGANITVKLRAINIREHFIRIPEPFYAIAMTLAPGIPLISLTETKSVDFESDSVYRAKLHRGLDLLVYSFFTNIIQHGFYHGDLHAGNIFFSFKSEQLTLIDFGAVGKLDILGETDETVQTLIKIIIQSVYFNYDGMLDTLTQLLNSKCVGAKSSILDVSSDVYLKFKADLHQIKLNNIKNTVHYSKNRDEYIEKLFSKERIDAESVQSTKMSDVEVSTSSDVVSKDSIYYVLNMPIPPQTENIDLEQKNLVGSDLMISNVNTTPIVSFEQIMKMMIEFYMTNGVNISVKLNEFNELQKAYALLLGVLKNVGYNSYRVGMSIKKAVVKLENIPKLFSLNGLSAIQFMLEEHSKYASTESEINNPKTDVESKRHYQQYIINKLQYYKLKYRLSEEEIKQYLQLFTYDANVDYLSKSNKYKRFIHQFVILNTPKLE